MKKIFYAIICALVAVGCQSSGKFTISGAFDSADGLGSVSLIEGITSMDEVIDMQELDGSGKFSFSGSVDTPYMAQISKSGSSMDASYRGIVFVESGNVKVSVNEMGQLIASGTPLNDKFNALIDEFSQKADEWQELPMAQQMAAFDALIEERVADNLDNPIGVFLLSQVVFRNQDLSGAEMLERLSMFTPEMQAGKDIAAVKAEIEVAAALDYGADYINIILPNVKGVDIALSSLVGEGKWVLLDFWATWCPPCMAEMPHLKEAYAEYNKLGFEICGVSLDNDKDAWQEYCLENLPWVNLLALGSVVADVYQVQSIPTNFLISPEGKIIAKNLRGSAISEELAKHIKK
ncbi:MAG: TlpA disulfide reductase family protein [Rikenellaceae bacterium]